MHVLPWYARPRRLRLLGQQSATDDDELHLVNVQAMKSSMKSQETYTAMLMCDSETVVDTHCSCGPSGARAFQCSHSAAMMVERECNSFENLGLWLLTLVSDFQ